MVRWNFFAPFSPSVSVGAAVDVLEAVDLLELGRRAVDLLGGLRACPAMSTFWSSISMLVDVERDLVLAAACGSMTSSRMSYAVIFGIGDARRARRPTGCRSSSSTSSARLRLAVTLAAISFASRVVERLLGLSQRDRGRRTRCPRRTRRSRAAAAPSGTAFARRNDRSTRDRERARAQVELRAATGGVVRHADRHRGGVDRQRAPRPRRRAAGRRARRRRRAVSRHAGMPSCSAEERRRCRAAARRRRRAAPRSA